MCKVVRFSFCCGHTAKLRRSRCRGTKQKTKSDGTRIAVCTAGDYIKINLASSCGPCQYSEWDRQWKEKLARAEIFQERVVRYGLPALGEVMDMVEMLQEQYDRSCWDIRTKFPPSTATRMIKRVEVSKVCRRGPSLLRSEVRPEDVVCPEDAGDDEASASCPELDPESCSPIDYTHPLDLADGSWADEYLSQLAEIGDAQEHDAVIEPQLDPLDYSWAEEFGNWTATPPGRLEARVYSSKDIVPMETDLNMAGEERWPDIPAQMIIDLFWQSIHMQSPQQQRQQQPPPSASPTLEHVLQGLHVPGTASASPGYPETDVDSRSAPSRLSSSSPTHSSPPRPPSPNDEDNRADPDGDPQRPRRDKTKFENYRTHLQATGLRNGSHADRVRYFQKWLEVSRLDIRHSEARRARPRLIPFPDAFAPHAEPASASPP